ncbi:MAG: hypothetical protein IK083_09115 [Abditibacteriota bacterium]|nr:hypothetical protein [Abditibacteriota bacterium]
MTRNTPLTARVLERLKADGSIVWFLVRTLRPAGEIRCPFDDRLAAKLRDPEAGPASGAEMVRLARMLQQSGRLLMADGTGRINAIGHIEAFSDSHCLVLPDHWVNFSLSEAEWEDANMDFMSRLSRHLTDPALRDETDKTGLLEPLTSDEAGKILDMLVPEARAAELNPERRLLPRWYDEYILPEALNTAVTGRILLSCDLFGEDSGAALPVSGEFCLTVASVPANTEVLIICREPDRPSESGYAANNEQVTVRGRITGFNAAYSRWTGKWTFYLCMEYHSVTDAFGRSLFVSFPERSGS